MTFDLIHTPLDLGVTRLEASAGTGKTRAGGDFSAPDRRGKNSGERYFGRHFYRSSHR